MSRMELPRFVSRITDRAITQGEVMTNTNLNPGSGKASVPVSINDNLPTSNPPLKVVLAVLGGFVLIALVLTFHSSLGF